MKWTWLPAAAAMVLCSATLLALAGCSLAPKQSDVSNWSGSRSVTIYENRIAAIFDGEILPLLTEAERDAIGDIRPALSTNLTEPAIFVQSVHSPNRRIIVGLGGVQFCDLLATTWAIEQALPEGELFAHLYQLFARRYLAQSPSARFPPDPLTAVGWTEQDLSYRERIVRDNFFDNVLFFVLAHEVGHICLHHKPPRTMEEAHDAEHEADAFAVELFIRRAERQNGSVYFFHVSNFFLGSAMVLERRMFGSPTHPSGWHRLTSVADAFLERRQELNLDHATTEDVKSILASARSIIDDPTAIEQIDQAAAEIDIESLRRRPPSHDPEQEVE